MKLLGGRYETHPAADLFPVMQGEEFAALVADIKANGLRHPIILLDGKVLDGRNRLLACDEAQKEPRFEDASPDRDPWASVWSENAERRHLEAGQKTAIRLLCLRQSSAWCGARDEAKRKADEARSAAQKGQPKPSKCVPEEERRGLSAKEFERKTGEARAPVNVVCNDAKHVQQHPSKLPPKPPKPEHAHNALAKDAGTSPRTAAAVLSLEKKAPDIFKRVAAGELTLPKAIGEQKLRAKAAVAQEIRTAPPVAPKGPFPVIAIDPPWKYDSRVEDASHRGRNQYPDMTVAEIVALPVPTLAAKDCILWLWTTNAFMREAYQILGEWGFTAKTILTWDKQKLGLGDWLRNVTEHCILATRGHPVVLLKGQTTLISEARREHSRKPEAFYALVEGLCPAPKGGRLEMFAREPREGWTAWGAETEKFAEVSHA